MRALMRRSQDDSGRSASLP